MRQSLICLLAASLGLLSAACVAEDGTDENAAAVLTQSVWTVDLIRTLPGQQSAYENSIEANWNGARALAVNREAVLSYRALVAPPDSARGWDVMLMTEYADSAAWEERERIFEEIFASPEYVRTPTALPSSELREFVAGGVVMTEFVRGGA